MKTTFIQYMLETQFSPGKLKAKTFLALYKSVENGKFTLDGTHLNTETVDISGIALTSLEGCPVEHVIDFNCMGNRLKSLKHCPLIVGGRFDCSHNNLTSLMDSPDEVGTFIAKGNYITSLEGISSYVYGDIELQHNRLTSLKDIHNHITWVEGKIFFSDNPIKSHVLGLLKIDELQKVIFNNAKLNDIINKYLPKGDIFECQQELIDAGLEAYAQL